MDIILPHSAAYAALSNYDIVQGLWILSSNISVQIWSGILHQIGLCISSITFNITMLELVTQISNVTTYSALDIFTVASRTYLHYQESLMPYSSSHYDIMLNGMFRTGRLILAIRNGDMVEAPWMVYGWSTWFKDNNIPHAIV